MLALRSAARELGLPTYQVHDAGRTQVRMRVEGVRRVEVPGLRLWRRVPDPCCAHLLANHGMPRGLAWHQLRAHVHVAPMPCR